jgi:hypothetical protein
MNDFCPECDKELLMYSSSRNCHSCYECVQAWRHKDCAKSHIDKTGHSGTLNDLAYLMDTVYEQPRISIRA